ncbi:PQQ-dependent sugar dehydrogenase [Massilia sp. CF038]|uniref:PQQ-dependent sugar dehydrogenase n=1 Tax=Massilia sp. CF038 TaxID=1881045 RepID=UPI000917A101|nr:PQQ-dependent sugar dehydrogenase [Massilia sp. CF038]SHG98655.1 Glucose/arabinose dehydrogenase, beta-propeller fold [Massilia sp. CF038]
MTRMMRTTLALCLGAMCMAPAFSQLQPSDAPPPATGWRSVTVAEGLSHPWGMAWLPDGRLLVTTKAGGLYILNGKKFDPVPMEGLPAVFTGGQGGLLDISVHPGDKKKDVRVYMTMATGTAEANRSTLVQGVFDGKRLHSIKTLFRVQQDKSGGQHFGSRLVWMQDGTLLMSIGDGGNPPQKVGDMLARDQAQNLATHQGSILHLTDGGKPAPGNPLVAKGGALPEIWSYGHRNIQGITRDAAGRIWATEHGPKGGDELNLIEGGQNYGWPLQSYGRDYRTSEPVGQNVVPGMTGPKVAWVPSPGPSGLAYYTGKDFPQWQGSLFSGGLASMDVRRIALDKDGNVTGQERLAIGQRVRDVKQGPDGRLYLITDEDKGKLLMLLPEK